MFQMKLALKYLRGKRKILFSGATILSFGGIVIGVFSLLIVSAVMNGFDNDIQRRVIGMKAEIKIHRHDYETIPESIDLERKLKNIPEIKAAAPVCETQLIIQKEDEVATTICFGIDLDKQQKVTHIFDNIIVGMPDKTTLSENGIILGLDLSIMLGVSVGEYVRLSSPLGTEPSPFGLLPRSKKFKVIGIFNSGMPEYDKIFSYISLANSRYFLGWKDGFEYLEIKTGNPDKSKKIAVKIQSLLGKNFAVEDWSEFDSNLFGAIKMEKIVMFVVLALMLIIAAFNMTGHFIKLIAEKRTEIGVLKALGASKKDVVKIFVFAGLIIGISGSVIGSLLAFIVLLLQKNYHFVSIPIAGFPLQWLPVQIRLSDFLFIIFVSVAVSFLFTLYPARKTIKIDPIKIIRS
ncbi:MAG: hypothetical protein DRZ79_04965 [Candidatus Cloacimonadota bacterium]|nr:MAG: hypothetical protein DRZ79_04965 [Candidatus Cloacimonadota bacterium]